MLLMVFLKNQFSVDYRTQSKLLQLEGWSTTWASPTTSIMLMTPRFTLSWKCLLHLHLPLFSSVCQFYKSSSVRMHCCWIRTNLQLFILVQAKRQRLRVSVLPESVTMAGNAITTTDKLKILGVVLDRSLSFDQHVLNTVRNCNFHLRALRHIRSSLTSDVANMMACSVIGSRIDYCNSLLIGISEQNLDRLQRVQNKAARIVCNASRHMLSSDLLHSLHWLPVRWRIELKTASLFQSSKTWHSSLLEEYVIIHHGHVNCFSYRHFSLISPFLCRRATNLEWATTWVATV